MYVRLEIDERTEGVEWQKSEGGERETKEKRNSEQLWATIMKMYASEEGTRGEREEEEEQKESEGYTNEWEAWEKRRSEKKAKKKTRDEGG